MRYFFHISMGGRTDRDEEGTLLSTPTVAMLQAAVIAAELAEDGANDRNCVIRVADELGNEIGEVPVVSDVEADTQIPFDLELDEGLGATRRAVVAAMLNTRQRLRTAGIGEIVILDAIWRVAVHSLVEAVGKARAVRYVRHVADRIENHPPAED